MKDKKFANGIVVGYSEGTRDKTVTLLQDADEINIPVRTFWAIAKYVSKRQQQIAALKYRGK